MRTLMINDYPHPAVSIDIKIGGFDICVGYDKRDEEKGWELDGIWTVQETRLFRERKDIYEYLKTEEFKKEILNHKKVRLRMAVGYGFTITP